LYIYLSKSKELAAGYEPIEVLFNDLHTVTNKGNYSNFMFNDNYRKKENYLPNKTNCLIFDFDCGVTMAIAFKLFEGFTYYCCTTKSHGLLKGGIRTDRFRILLPLITPVFCDADIFQRTMKKLAWAVGADQNACDAARMYNGHPGIFFYNYGKLFDFTPWIDKPVNCDEFRLRRSVMNRLPATYLNDASFVLNPANWEICFKPKEIVSGGRNAAFARIALWLKDAGATTDILATAMWWLNDHISDPLPAREVELLIKSKVR